MFRLGVRRRFAVAATPFAQERAQEVAAHEQYEQPRCVAGERASGLGVLTANATASPSFAATLDGSDRVAAYTTSLDIADTRETASGWHLTAAATQFATAGPTPQTLPADASSISGVTATCAVEPCIAPINAIAYPVAVAAGGPSVKFFSAGSGSGSGRFTIAPTTSVTIPANAHSGTYSSTVTYTLASGP